MTEGGPLRVLHAYLLGQVPYEDWLVLQRRLVYDVSGDRGAASLVLCEHPQAISIGREGSTAHVLLEESELASLGWPIHWVNRGAGCLLHAPGQLNVYPILALDQLGINVQEYLDMLHETIRSVLLELEIAAQVRPPAHGVWVGDRRIAHVGIAVRDWVAYHGFAINVETNLKSFHLVQCNGDERPMTSIARECRQRVRPAAIRLRLISQLAAQLGFDRVLRFHRHPALAPKEPEHCGMMLEGR